MVVLSARSPGTSIKSNAALCQSASESENEIESARLMAKIISANKR
jgi:hypothetical protein